MITEGITPEGITRSSLTVSVILWGMACEREAREWRVAEMDHGINRLIQTRPADVLALALPDIEYLGTLPVDVATEPQLVLDTLLRVRDRGVICAVDLEAEARPAGDIGRRLYEYGTRASIVTDLPIISVVFWLEPNGVAPSSPYELRTPSRLIATWHYIGIKVYELPAEAVLELGLPGLLPLIPFTRGGADLGMIERTAELVAQRAPAEEAEILESLLFVFAARSFEASVLLAMMRRLHMSTEIIEKSAFYQEALARGRTQGIEQGIEQGKAEGVHQGIYDATVAVLRGRFGTLSPELEQALVAATSEAMQRMLAHAATETPEQLIERLRG